MDFELKQTITQILAFLIMLWILKRYTWKPLLSVLDERTRKIQALFNEAEEKNQEADQRKQLYDQKINDIKNEGQVIIQNAVKEAKRIGEELEANSQKKAQAIILKGIEQSERDALKARAAFKKDMIDISFHALEKLIHLKLDKEEQNRLALDMLKDI